MNIILTGCSLDGYAVFLVKGDRGIFSVEDFCKTLKIKPDYYSEIEAQVFVKKSGYLATVLVPQKYLQGI